MSKNKWTHVQLKVEHSLPPADDTVLLYTLEKGYFFGRIEPYYDAWKRINYYYTVGNAKPQVIRSIEMWWQPLPELTKWKRLNMNEPKWAPKLNESTMMFTESTGFFIGKVIESEYDEGEFYIHYARLSRKPCSDMEVLWLLLPSKPIINVA